jgi:hypothetical protein
VTVQIKLCTPGPRAQGHRSSDSPVLSDNLEAFSSGLNGPVPGNTGFIG